MTATTGLTILINDFHNTEYRSRKTREELEAIEHRINTFAADAADKALARRAWNALCGIEGCTCGQGLFGERPARVADDVDMDAIEAAESNGCGI